MPATSCALLLAWWAPAGAVGVSVRFDARPGPPRYQRGGSRRGLLVIDRSLGSRSWCFAGSTARCRSQTTIPRSAMVTGCPRPATRDQPNSRRRCRGALALPVLSSHASNTQVTVEPRRRREHEAITIDLPARRRQGKPTKVRRADCFDHVLPVELAARGEHGQRRTGYDQATLLQSGPCRP